MRTIRERKRGFTIIELLIVIAIIAILAAVAIPALLRAQKSGKESAATQVLKSLRTAEESYKVKNKAYAKLDALVTDGSSPVGEGKVESASGFTFTSDAGTDAFTIVAIPPKTDMSTYTLVESGEILQ
ncbi:MAG: prepilin-type N-terminal cleavage/methylation domain-containing protein [Armatimonadetes bacterium]|nr:prepilin-type N-terminal cleavage/methylation domain-containing protein [Armatimonadota bacterium]